MTLFKIGFITVTLVDVVDLLLVSWIFYMVYQYFKGTRAGQMLVGLIILLIGSFLFNASGMQATSWLVNRFQTVWVVAFVILFQPEIRRLLIYVGQHRFFQKIFRVGTSQTIESLVQSIQLLIEKKWGALIVIQRETGLRSYKESGTPLKAEVSTGLLLSIFNPGSPLHDGAVIIQNDIIESAGCILPLSESTTINPGMGTRHRAGLGLSEETDAIIILVSEETARVSIAEDGKFSHIGMDEMDLRRFLNSEMFISSGD
jgi:diadenylate cyclase